MTVLNSIWSVLLTNDKIIMIEMFSMFSMFQLLLLRAGRWLPQSVSKQWCRCLLVHFISSICLQLFFSVQYWGGRGDTNDLFTGEAINLEYLYIMQWTGQLWSLLHDTHIQKHPLPLNKLLKRQAQETTSIIICYSDPRPLNRPVLQIIG